jgi:hypothetical protein
VTTGHASALHPFSASVVLPPYLLNGGAELGVFFL